jgi:hypothetical protein
MNTPETNQPSLLAPPAYGELLLAVRIQVRRRDIVEGFPGTLHPANNFCGATCLALAFQMAFAMETMHGVGPLNDSIYIIRTSRFGLAEALQHLKEMLRAPMLYHYAAIFHFDEREQFFRLMHKGESTDQAPIFSEDTFRADIAAIESDIDELRKNQAEFVRRFNLQSPDNKSNPPAPENP